MDGLPGGLIGEAKSYAQLDYTPSRKLAVNQTFTLSAMLAHNLGRELQMSAEDPSTRSSLCIQRSRPQDGAHLTG